MRRLAAAAAALALLAACSGNGPGAQPDARLPAPTPSDVERRLSAAQNGETIEVDVNQRFAIELIGVPTAGYVWAPAQIPAFITRAGEASGATIAAQNEPGYAGGNHWEVLMFAATGPGTGELVLEQRRPWETDQPAADTFRVTIVAR